MSKKSRTFFKLLGICAIAFLAVVLLFPTSNWLAAWYNTLSEGIKLVINLAGIGLIALVFAGVEAPLEALGWWAGWYGDTLEPPANLGTVERATPVPGEVARYVIYLDGIGQATFKYLPEGEEFLTQLEAALPDNVLLIRGLMPYSVLNQPLTGDRPLAFFWRWADRFRLKNPQSLVGFFVNIRNMMVVAVSADQRYGPIYNRGTAQVMYNSLLNHGYQPDSGVPITLIGFSGGGQISLGAAPFLKQALAAPIDVISLGGFLSGNNQFLQLEHFYHLVGNKDKVARGASIVFPRRWKLLFLSYWNRARNRGKVSFISLGPVGHQLPGGIMDSKQYLPEPDGRSYLQQTVDLVTGIIKGDLLIAHKSAPRKPSKYELYQQAAFNRPGYYPLRQSVALELYRPLATWMGRLILPGIDQRQTVKGTLLEVHHADANHQHLVGQVVNLRWSDAPQVQEYVRAVTRDVHFSQEVNYTITQGLIHPERLNHWQQVNPLESLAGARPNDDLCVMLREPVAVEESPGDGDAPTLYISSEPVQINGRFYGLVQFLQAVEGGSDQFRVVHFNRTSREFDGEEEIVSMPQVIADQEEIFPSTSRGIEESPLNRTGWYIYGAQDHSGMFVVQAIAPRALWRLQPERVIVGKKAGLKYLKKQSWADLVAQKGKVASVLLSPQERGIQEAIDEWQEGDRALLVHVYGGIGGNKAEPAARAPLYFGHFAYGIAQVVREPLSEELRFELEYQQVYTHNTSGLIAGTHHWSRYMGDRQWGFLGIRPVVDILIKLDAYTKDYDFDGQQRCALEVMRGQLETMMARYRIGDGTGGTYVGPANNCSQDANQALYAAIKQVERAIKANADFFKDWTERHPEQGERFEQLVKLGKSLKGELLPLGTARADWQNSDEVLGISLEDYPLKSLLRGLGSWRTMLPRVASDTVVKLFLEQGASIWVLRTNQVGGFDPDIEPIAPMTF